MSKKSFIRFTLFASRPKVAGKKLYPLAAGRMLILEELKNPLGVGNVGAEIDTRSVHEAFLVASMDKKELAVLTEDLDEFRKYVREFSMDFSDEHLNEFWELMQDEIEAINAKQAEVVGKKKAAGKRASKKAVSRRSKKK